MGLSAWGQNCDLAKQKLCFEFLGSKASQGRASRLRVGSKGKSPWCLLVPLYGNLGTNFIIYSQIENKMLFSVNGVKGLCGFLCSRLQVSKAASRVPQSRPFLSDTSLPLCKRVENVNSLFQREMHCFLHRMPVEKCYFLPGFSGRQNVNILHSGV